MARDTWARPARELATAMAKAGASRDTIREALGDWIHEDATRLRLLSQPEPEPIAPVVAIARRRAAA